MSYYAEMQKQTTISQLAMCVIVVSMATIIVAIAKLWSMGGREFSEMAWPMLILLVALSGVGFGVRTRQASRAKGEMVRSSGGRYALNASQGHHQH